MKKAWQNIDLDGGGLQTVNLRYRQLQKKAALAYRLWFLFPFGVHRFYLQSRLIGLTYLSITIGFIVLATVTEISPLWIMLELPLALFDLRWINHRVTELNKSLRIHLYSSTDAKPPAGYKGRVLEDSDPISDYISLKDQEKAGIGGKELAGSTNQHIPSFKEQENLLRALADKKKRKT